MRDCRFSFACNLSASLGIPIYRLQHSMYLEFRREVYFRGAEFRMTAWAATAMSADEPRKMSATKK